MEGSRYRSQESYSLTHETPRLGLHARSKAPFPERAQGRGTSGGAVMTALFFVLACLAACAVGVFVMALVTSSKIGDLRATLVEVRKSYQRGCAREGEAHASAWRGYLAKVDAERIASEAMTAGLAECEGLRAALKEEGRTRQIRGFDNGYQKAFDRGMLRYRNARTETRSAIAERDAARSALARANAEVSEIQDAAVRQGMRLAADMIDDAAGKGHRFSSMAKVIREHAAAPPVATKKGRAA